MRKQLLFGALAGALGGVAMKAVVRFLDPASFGLSAKTDAKTAHVLWPRVSEKRAALIGSAMHYSFSIAAGALYAAGAARFPPLRSGRGAVFGGALWLIGDEVAVSVSRLEDPRKTPLVSHASALGAHILYGTVVDRVLKDTLRID